MPPAAVFRGDGTREPRSEASIYRFRASGTSR